MSAWTAKYLTALVTEATPYSWAARLCALGVLGSSLAIVLVSWMGGTPWPTTFGVGPAMVPYTMLSFGLSGIALAIATFHAKPINPHFSEGAKTALSVVLLALASIAAVDMIYHLDSLLSWQLPNDAQWDIDTAQRGYPSPVKIAGFVLLSILGGVDFKSPWRYFLGSMVGLIGMVALCGHLLAAPRVYYYFAGHTTGMAWLTALLFVLSGAGYILMTKHWRTFQGGAAPPNHGPG